MILTLVTLGKFFEARAKRKTGEAIAALMDLRPQTAEVIRGGQTMQLPIEQVQVGDLVIVRGGQSVPVDGEITEGQRLSGRKRHHRREHAKNARRYRNRRYRIQRAAMLL